MPDSDSQRESLARETSILRVTENGAGLVGLASGWSSHARLS